MVLQYSAFSSLVVFAFLTSASAVCPCKYQGLEIPGTIYNAFPNKKPANCVGTSCTKYPGMYQNLSVVNVYGSNCAAWDQMPGTPWYSSCPSGSKWSDKDFNWCQLPWCYVDATCADGVATGVYAGSPIAFFSYKSCGNTANCYSNIAWNASWDKVWPSGCPYDPTGGKTYKIHKSGNCACKFHGKILNASLYNGFPSSAPGKYKSYSAIKSYGTTCGAWDQVPGTPWFSYCPAGSDWCHYDYNWCQQPWCYVSASCATGVATSVFAGSSVAFFSYDTCLTTPNCYTAIAWNATPFPPTKCPFDSSDNSWHTAKKCPSGWTPTGTKFSGTISVVITGTQVQVQVATQKALARHFDVPVYSVTTTATESRRLGPNVPPRRLAGTWSIAFEFRASAKKAAAVATKVTALTTDPNTFKSTFTPILKAELTSAGVPATQVNAMVLKTVSAAGTASTTSTTGKDLTSSALSHTLPLGVLVVCLASMAWPRS